MSAETLAPRLERLEQLLSEVERAADPDTRARTREIVSVVLELHGAGLARLMELVGSGADVLGCARDPLVGSVLLLHGLHPLALESRVQEALGRFAPDEAALVSVVAGVVRLRVTAPRLRASVVAAVSAAAPDASEIAVDDDSEPLISVERLRAVRR